MRRWLVALGAIVRARRERATGEVRNTVTGNVPGATLQAGVITEPTVIGTVHAPVTQNAVASGNATIMQAGGEINISGKRAPGES